MKKFKDFRKFFFSYFVLQIIKLVLVFLVKQKQLISTFLNFQLPLMYKKSKKKLKKFEIFVNLKYFSNLTSLSAWVELKWPFQISATWTTIWSALIYIKKKNKKNLLIFNFFKKKFFLYLWQINAKMLLVYEIYPNLMQFSDSILKFFKKIQKNSKIFAKKNCFFIRQTFSLVKELYYYTAHSKFCKKKHNTFLKILK